MTFKDLDRKTRKVKASLDGLGKWVKVVGVIVAAIVGVWASGYGASAYLDLRYVLATRMALHEVAEARDNAQNQLLFLENRQGQLEDQLFRYRQEESRRRLAPLERERKEQIERELDRMGLKIKELRPKVQP